MSNNERLIVTILIQTHGSVIETDLTAETSNWFENVRLSCAAGGFNNYNTNIIKNIKTINQHKKQFVTDIGDDISTYKLMENINNNMFVPNITFDKSIAIGDSQGFLNFINLNGYITPDGVYLVSIHKGKKLEFPLSNKDKMISLLHIENLKELSIMFQKKNALPDIENISTSLPVKEYITMENEINKDASLSQPKKDNKIKEIQEEFYRILNNWKLTIDKSKKIITAVKLSYFVHLIKTIISNDCIINLLDYSCNTPSVYIPDDKLSKLLYAYNINDIESNSANIWLGGKRTRKNIYKKRKIYSKKNKKLHKKMYKTHRYK